MTDAEFNDTIIMLISALAAAISFVVATLPLLNKSERQDRYKSVIEKRKRDLMAQAQSEFGPKDQDKVSARDSMAAIFKLQRMMGEYGEKARDQLLVAGIRDPKAPMKFIMARILLPVFFMAFGMLILSKGDSSGGKTMFILMILSVAGYFLPNILVKNQAQKRQEEINLTFPDALDLMLICVQGGMGLEQTVARIADEMSENSPILAEELGILSAEMAMLDSRSEALKDFGRRVGSGAGKSFASALIQAEQYGTSVTQALRVMSDELREMRMQAAEQKAASLPPKLTVPMIAFFLPVLFVVILGPSIIEIMKD
jgi:tight adherence protein C